MDIIKLGSLYSLKICLIKHLATKIALIKSLGIIYCIFIKWLTTTIIFINGPQSRTLQPVRGEGYEPAYKSRANAKIHPRLGAGGCHSILKG